MPGSRRTAEQATAEFARFHVELQSDWVGVMAKIVGVCMLCRAKVQPRLNDLLRGSGACEKCTKDGSSAAFTCTQMGLTMTGEYSSCRAPLAVQCSCGHEFETTLTNLRTGKSCPVCLPPDQECTAQGESEQDATKPGPDLVALFNGAGFALIGVLRDDDLPLACVCLVCGKPADVSIPKAKSRAAQCVNGCVAAVSEQELEGAAAGV